MTILATILVATVALASARPRSAGDSSAKREAAADHCEHLTLRNRTGFITTPGYPGAYSNNMNCSFTIEIPDLPSYTVDFYACSFQIEDSYDGNCTYDYLEVGGLKFCGLEAGWNVTIPSSNGKVDVLFISDFIVAMHGALVFYSVNNKNENLFDHCSSWEYPDNWNYTSPGYNYTDPPIFYTDPPIFPYPENWTVPWENPGYNYTDPPIFPYPENWTLPWENPGYNYTDPPIFPYPENWTLPWENPGYNYTDPPIFPYPENWTLPWENPGYNYTDPPIFPYPENWTLPWENPGYNYTDPPVFPYPENWTLPWENPGYNYTDPPIFPYPENWTLPWENPGYNYTDPPIFPYPENWTEVQ